MTETTAAPAKEFEEIGNLLRKIRLLRGMSQSDLASVVGINNSYLSRIENGERRPSPRILKKFSDILNYSYDELVVKSKILPEDFVRTSAETEKNSPTNEMLRTIIATMQGRGQGLDAAPSFGGQSFGPPPARRGIPVFDTVPAGLLKDANVVEGHDDLRQIVLSEEELAFDPRAFALIVKGDSMIEAGILDGDVVVVSPATQVHNGDIAVVLVNRMSTSVKKVHFDSNRLILQAANSNYAPLVLSYPDEVEILGKVVLVRRKLA